VEEKTRFLGLFLDCGLGSGSFADPAKMSAESLAEAGISDSERVRVPVEMIGIQSHQSRPKSGKVDATK
jgi:hypothetical protein